jgi:hypothetical protein
MRHRCTVISLTIGLALGTLTGCWEHVLIPTSAPTIRGTIRGPGDLGSLLVESGTPETCDLKDAAQVIVKGDTPIFRRSRKSARQSDLTVGTIVSVWSSGRPLQTCPGIIAATTVVIE